MSHSTKLIQYNKHKTNSNADLVLLYRLSCKIITSQDEFWMTILTNVFIIVNKLLIQASNLISYQVFLDRLWTLHNILSLSEGAPVNNNETDRRPTSLAHCLFNGCNMIPLTCNIKKITSSWWFRIAWCLFDARASATIAMAYLGRCVSGVINVMIYRSGVCSVVSDCSTLVQVQHTAESCASHSPAKVCGQWNIFDSSPTG